MNSRMPLEGFQIREVEAADAAAEPVFRYLFWMVNPGMAVPVSPGPEQQRHIIV